MNAIVYNVQSDRIKNANCLPFYKRLINRCIAYAIIHFFLLSGYVWKIFHRRNKVYDSPARVMLTGRFESDNWLRAHIKPLADSDYCEHVWVVSDHPLVSMNKVSYICPHKYCVMILGGVFSRILYLVFYTIKYRIDIVGGFHLLINAIVADGVAKLASAKSLYFCVGGWSEIIGGGAYSGTSIFGYTGVDDKLLEKKLLTLISKIDQVIVMGNRAKSYFSEYGIKHVNVLPGGIEKGIFNITDSPEKKQFDIILVARLDPIKRIDRFIKIVSIIAKMNPKLRAVIVGDSDLKKKYQDLAKEYQIEQNIYFAGHQSDVSQWLLRSKLFVLTSDSEGLPLSCMEAMIMGVPIVASDIGDLRDLVHNGANGYLVEPGNINEFVDKITCILTNNEKYNSLSKESIVTSENFQYSAARDSWDNVFSRMGFAK